MVLNSDFWDALTGTQRCRFAKANCEATYKKAIMTQILAVVLGVLGIGLFLPVANNARRYWKGYYSLREEYMPGAVKAMCGINFILGLFANIIIMLVREDDEYGLFVNTMSRRKLEAMLNEPDAVPVVNVGSDDPFRISKFTPVQNPDENRLVRKGCENFPEGLLLTINVVIIVVAIVAMSLIFSFCSGGGKGKEPTSSTPSNVSSEQPVSSTVDASQFGDITVTPTDWSKSVSMSVTTDSGLKLRKGPTTNDEIITVMPNKSKVTVLNDTDVKNWCFVSFEKDGETLYGWACARVGDEQYLTDLSATSSDASSVDPENLLSSKELKEMAVGHIQAVADIENGFIGYVKCNVEDDEKGVFFGSDNIGEYYYLVTNANGTSDISQYLSKYMISNLVSQKAHVPVVESNDSVPESPLVSYNGSLYVSGSASANYTVDMSTFSVLSSSENSYIVLVSAKDSENNEAKYTINMQYTDEKLTITSYTVK